jgi:transcriptional regulator with XRE-family HTH domain
VTTAEAIVKLREKLGYTQVQLASALGLTVVTISRYENGREPKEDVLGLLANLAKEAGALHLQDLFQVMRRSDIASRVEGLPSQGAARRMPITDIRHIYEGLFVIKQGIARLESGELSIEKQKETTVAVASVVSSLQAFVAPYLAPDLDQDHLRLLDIAGLRRSFPGNSALTALGVDGDKAIRNMKLRLERASALVDAAKTKSKS